jgi:hypothetical protein
LTTIFKLRRVNKAHCSFERTTTYAEPDPISKKYLLRRYYISVISQQALGSRPIHTSAPQSPTTCLGLTQTHSLPSLPARPPPSAAAHPSLAPTASTTAPAQRMQVSPLVGAIQVGMQEAEAVAQDYRKYSKDCSSSRRWTLRLRCGR